MVGRIRICLIENHTFVPGLLQYGGQRHDPDGWKAHYTDVAVFGASFCGKSVKLRIANVDQKDSQTDSLIGLNQRSMPGTVADD